VIQLIINSGAFMLCGWSYRPWGGLSSLLLFFFFLCVEWNELIYDQVICHMLITSIFYGSRNGMN